MAANVITMRGSQKNGEVLQWGIDRLVAARVDYVEQAEIPFSPKFKNRREISMAKCAGCGERKGNRLCPGLNASICSLCCGTKREKEISCLESCSHLKSGKDHQLEREIDRRISSDLHAETTDVFGTDEATEFVMPLERFFVDQFYRHREVNDLRINEALTKIYAFQRGILPVLQGGNRAEELILKKFGEVNRKFSNLPDDLKARAILRIIKSIRSSSGGALGNRNYLEMIYSQHTGKGRWAGLFHKLETDG
jgi:hypothetical protein